MLIYVHYFRAGVISFTEISQDDHSLRRLQNQPRYANIHSDEKIDEIGGKGHLRLGYVGQADARRPTRLAGHH